MNNDMTKKIKEIIHSFPLPYEVNNLIWKEYRKPLDKDTSLKWVLKKRLELHEYSVHELTSHYNKIMFSKTRYRPTMLIIEYKDDMIEKLLSLLKSCDVYTKVYWNRDKDHFIYKLRHHPRYTIVFRRILSYPDDEVDYDWEYMYEAVRGTCTCDYTCNCCSLIPTEYRQ